MQPPVNYPGNQPSSPYGGAPNVGAGAPYGGGMPGYPSAASMAVDPRTVPPHLAPAPGVSMIEAYKRYFKRAFTFNGYASRGEYWWAVLANALVALALYIPAAILLAVDGGESSFAGVLAGILSLVLMLFYVINIVPGISVLVRRLHDTGRPGLWALLALVPFGGIVLVVFAAMESRPDMWRPEWSR